LHCVDLTLLSAFLPSMFNATVNVLSSSLHYHYMFWSNRPSSDVQLAVMTESVTHCFSYAVAPDSRLCGLTNCFIWAYLNNCYACVCLMALLVCWFVACGSPQCLGRSLLYSGRPSQLLIVGCLNKTAG
jgi:hypothetical protein